MSLKDALDLIRWAPKMGFNSIFFEGINQWKSFFYRSRRYYKSLGNPMEKPELLPESVLKMHFEQAVQEVKELGLLYHEAGHGFNCLPFGVEPSFKGEVSEAVSKHLALINGKREIQDSAADTNICMSNFETRKIVINYIADYVKKHPHVDLVHVWLSDGVRNHCECENCKDILPSDLYILLLNELDEELTRHDLNARIVFIAYCDLIWKPEVNKLKNPCRFILTYAPFHRTFLKSYNDASEIPGMPPFVRNKNSYPRTIEGTLSFIRSWQKYFKGDSFMFDYHFWRAQYSDPGHFRIARIVYDDTSSLKKYGINGNISCQVTKNFLTAGLGMYVMGRTL